MGEKYMYLMETTHIDRDNRITLISEESNLINSKDDIKTYKRRWYILALFAVFALLQSDVYIAYGPVALSSMFAFGWTAAEIGLQIELGNIAFLLTCVPLTWMLSTKGLRLAVLTGVSLTTTAAVMRCITMDPNMEFWLANIAGALNGAAGVIALAANSYLSVTWFPVHERATATGVASLAPSLGSFLSLIGPRVVPEVPNFSAHESTSGNNFTVGWTNYTSNRTTVMDMRKHVLTLMWIEGGCCLLLLLLVALLFQDKPPTPPSITASTVRTEYIKGLKSLLLNRKFITIGVAFSLPVGVYLAWMSTLAVNLGAINISQVATGWVVFLSVTGAFVTGVLIARLADMFIHHTKKFLLMLFGIAAAAAFCFLLLRQKFIPFNEYCLYVTAIICGASLNASPPLLFELACEAAYPVGEVVVVGMMNFGSQLVGVIFLTTLLFPHTGLNWMNWCLLASAVIPIPLIVIFKAKYTRSDIDTKDEKDESY